MKTRSYDPFVFVKIGLTSIFAFFIVMANAIPASYCGPSSVISSNYCSVEVGQEVTLTYTGGGTYESINWNGVNTLSTVVSYSWTTPGTRTVSLQLVYCDPGFPECTTPVSVPEYIDITVVPEPEPFRVDLDGPSTVCIDDHAFFVATCLPGYSIFTWRIDGEDQPLDDVVITTTSALKTLQFPLHYFLTTGNHTVEFIAQCDEGPTQGCTGDVSTDGYVSKSVYVKPRPNASISANPVSGCGAYSVNLTLANIESGATYQWTSDDGQIASGNSVTLWAGLNGKSSTNFTVTATKDGCQNTQSTTLTSWVTSYGAIYEQNYHKSFVKFEYTGQGYTPLSSHYWQETPQGTTTDHSLADDPFEGFAITEPKTFYINTLHPSANCWTSDQGPFTIPISYTPPQVTVTQNQKYGYNEITFDVPDKNFVLQYADYYIVDSPSSEMVDPSKKITEVFRVFKEGTHYIRGVDRATNTWGFSTAFSVELMKDYSLNWIRTASFDGNGDKIAESKNYFDYTGKALQSQSRNVSANRILATESLYDRYDRVAGSTLPAPILSNEFNYNGLFLMNPDGEKYKASDFDGSATLFDPRPVNTVEGTIGWYYSNNNSDEPNTPMTQFPYSRVEFYEEGFEEAKRSASPGDQFRLGSGHEIVNGTFPVYHELDDYLIQRSLAIPGISTPNSSLRNEMVQSVSRDQNGKFVVAIKDKSGNTIMSARAGTEADHVLQVDNSVIASSDPNSSNYKTVVYLYLLHQQPVTITGGGVYEVDNILDNEVFTPSEEWPIGFYRVRILTGEISISYSNYYLDVSYNYYDDIGRLMSSLSPNGVGQLNGGTLYTETDHTTYKYNHQGWLLSMTETDAGTTRYGYRKDGSIRFSQNAEQEVDNKYSYTNYDNSGRPVESGEYIAPVGLLFNDVISNSIVLESHNDSWMVGNPAQTRKDWVKTHYDLPYAGLSAILPDKEQDFLIGSVSWTENENIKTWYSYDELGRVTWMAQQPLAMGNMLFLTEYSYDFLGNVLTVVNKSRTVGNATDKSLFYHHYTYDADKRLSQVHTSLDGSNMKLQARYDYYLHGPLKRIELANNLQGIDFVYNINGWLQSINDPSSDPGKDGEAGGNSNFRKDAFGMVLDYYESSLQIFEPSGILKLHNPSDFHKLPSIDWDSEVNKGSNSLPFLRKQLRESWEVLKQQREISGGE